MAAKRSKTILKGNDAKSNRTRGLLNVIYYALNSAASGVIITKRTGEIMYVNPSFLKIFGYDNKLEVIGKNAKDFFTKKEVTSFSDVEAIINESREGTEEFFVRHKDGTLFLAEVSASNVSDHTGKVVGRMASFIDITERKQLEKELRNSEKKLRQLSHRILDAQEEERKIIAHELHDGIGAALTNIKYALEQRIEDHPQEQESLEKPISLIENAIKDTSRISRSLRPSILDDMGVIPGIKWFCRDFQEAHSNITIKICIEVQEVDIREPLKLMMYRIVQEALNNVAKHSMAQNAKVSLIKAEGKLQLSIEDNGRGFDSQQTGDAGMGLSSMKERTQFSGGFFSIHSTPGKGTIIQASWPLELEKSDY